MFTIWHFNLNFAFLFASLLDCIDSNILYEKRKQFIVYEGILMIHIQMFVLLRIQINNFAPR